MSNEFANLKLELIEPSLTNPRKNFNAAKLTELAESIKASGVHQPILVRPLPGGRVADTARGVQFELVCGERRLRASEQAGVITIPAMVRALTDAQVLEIQIVENLQRDDLTELEEAEGYEALMQHANLTADQVGEKISKSRSYVYGRLKLLDLCFEARSSLRDGAIEASNARLVARIPDHKLQIKAMKEIVAGVGYHGDREPMTYREAAAHVQRTYMLKLDAAKFPIENMDLLPAAGSCKTCGKRTGNDPDLFSEVKSADVCTDPPCFHKKEEAHAANLISEAKAKGQTVIAGKEAQELMTSNYDAKFKGYRRLDSAEDSPTDQPLRKIIGKQMEAEGISPVMIQHPQKGMVATLPNEVVLRLLKTVEGQAAAAQAVTKEVRKFADEKKAKAQAKAQAAYEQAWRDELIACTHHDMEKQPGVHGFTLDLHRFLAVRAAHNTSSDNAAKLCKLLDLGKVACGSALVDHAKTCPRPDLLHMLMIAQHDSSANDYDWSASGRVANEGMHLVTGIVFKDTLKEVTKNIKTASMERYFPKAEAKKAPTATAPAARPTGGAGGFQDKGTKHKAPRANAAKLSAQEATLGIADALQGMEGVASADAVAPPAEPAVGFVLGQRVRITTLDERLSSTARKWSGKEGAITKTNAEHDPDLYDVTFKGRSGGIAMFRTDQIEAVAA